MNEVRTIHLHGDLQKYGKQFEYDFKYPAEALNFLTSQLPGFKADLLKHSKIAFVKSHEDKLTEINEENIQMAMGRNTDLHLVPVAHGSGFEVGAAVATAIIGSTVAATSIAAIVTTVLLNIALSFAVSAVVQALSPSPKTGGTTGRKNEQSFVFSGQANVMEQGYPVPLVFGRFRGSSVTVSVGMESYDIAIPEDQPQPAQPQEDYNAPYNDGGGDGGGDGGDGGDGDGGGDGGEGE
jgi:predicted phage tail protein